MLRRGQGPPPLPMAAALCLYSHLLSAGWSKRKPFPGRHPAPAAVCESKGDKAQGYLLWESISRLSWVRELMAVKVGIQPANCSLPLTGIFLLAVKKTQGDQRIKSNRRNKELCSPACGDRIWMRPAVWKIYSFFSWGIFLAKLV